MEQQAEAMAPVPWHERNQLSAADIQPMDTTPNTLPNCETSVVEDGGDAKQLAQGHNIFSKPCEENCNEFNKRNDLTHVGGGFPLQNPSRDLLDGIQADISEALSERNLEELLRTAMITSIGREWGQKSFVPVDDLDRIINIKTHSELERLKMVPDESLKDLANKICEIHDGKSPQDGKMTLTSRRRFFAILVLINQASAILEVINESLYDWDLPLALDRSRPGFPQLVKKGTEDKPDPVAFSQDWQPIQHEIFFRCQWQLLSPYIEMRGQVGARINHYRLDPETILPITNIDGPDRCGGFGSVSKIQIHPAHRNSWASDSESWLALKRLHYSNEEAFRAEVDPLKRLKDHPHLIQLLATYRYGEDYYLLFPWASGGNLDDFFHSYARVDFPQRDPKLSKWMASQLLGLSDALASIHNCEVDPAAANMSGFNSNEIRKKYGTHGDLKPENLLWFKENNTGGDNHLLGTFQISDFGLTSFHGLESRQKFKPSGISATYRAPEYDLNGRVSQQYDMWSLGCVLTELVTWYLLGGDAVTKFRDERLEDTTPGVKEDIFFSLPDHPDHHSMGRATEKRSVCKHLSMLRNLPGCTDFLLELIDFIDRRLLRMRPGKRCQVPQLLQFAKSINQKCHGDNNYCLERIKPIETRQGTNLSELVSGSIPYPITQKTSSSKSSLEIVLLKPDVRGPKQNIMHLDTQDSKNRKSIMGPTKLSLEMRQGERPRSVSTVREIETPIASPLNEEIESQRRVEPHLMPNLGNTWNDGDNKSGGDDLNISTSASQRRSKAKLSSTVSQNDTTRTGKSHRSSGEMPKECYSDASGSLLHPGSDQPTSNLAEKAVKHETYRVSEHCLGLSRIWVKIRTRWTFIRE